MAARIAGITIPNDKRIEIALTYIYGIGRVRSKTILHDLKVNPNSRTKDLNESEINELRRHIENEFRVEGELKRDVLTNVKRLKEVDSYRGSRHAKKLPARGQRTKTNSRTLRGNKRVTMGSGRKDASQKT
jgi:small subunit ribosomal protein S13